MGRTYFGLALSSSMFEGDLIITRRVLSPEEVRRVVADGVDSYLSSTHKSIIRVLESRFGISVGIPKISPRIRLRKGDRLLVMRVRHLPQLTGCQEHTQQEIDAAVFEFVLYTVYDFYQQERVPFIVDEVDPLLVDSAVAYAAGDH